MGGGKSWGRARIVVPLVLLGMIFMRLIWMQLRAYAYDQDSRAVMAMEFLAERLDDRCQYARLFTAPSSTAAAEGSAEVRVVRGMLTSIGMAFEGLFLCRQDWLEERAAARVNQWVFTGTVLAATLMARFIGGNWTVALIVATMLMSRGRLLGGLGVVSADGMIAFSVTAWMASAAHFLRTGATASLLALALLLWLGTTFDRSLTALALAPPMLLAMGYVWRRKLAKPVIRRFRGAQEQRGSHLGPVARGALGTESVDNARARLIATARWMLGLEFPPPVALSEALPDYGRGGLFRTIRMPFLLWVYTRRRWLKFGVVFAACGVVAIFLALALFAWVAAPLAFGDLGIFREALQFSLAPAWYQTWLDVGLSRFDLHLTASVVVILVCGIQSPAAGLAGYLELAWLAVASFLAVAAAALLADVVDAELVLRLGRERRATALMMDLGARSVVAWFEPTLLALGAVGVYNLMKVLDTRFADKT